MTVVEGWFGDKTVSGADLKNSDSLSPDILDVVAQNVAINRSCEVHFKDDLVRIIPADSHVSFFDCICEWIIEHNQFPRADSRKAVFSLVVWFVCLSCLVSTYSIALEQRISCCNSVRFADAQDERYAVLFFYLEAWKTNNSLSWDFS